MCIVYLKRNPSEKIKLLIISNRDEFYDRPYHKISVWDNGTIAGKDLKNGGTWFGFNKAGNFAFVTNYRQFPLESKEFESRGELVKNYLETGYIPYKQRINDYRPFNFVYGNINNMSFISNKDEHIESIKSNELCVSNGKVSDSWTKMQRIQKMVNQIDFTKDILGLKEDLFKILKDQTKADITQLPKTGLSTEQELLISSIFIQSPNYGTISQNISIIDSQNVLHMFEYDVLAQTSEYIKVQLD